MPEKLSEYRRKRDFSKTAEPSGKRPRDRAARLRFVVQKHAASHLHYDFRLELDGVLKSWAIPKGPSLDPAVKRLAMEVEDHPIEYRDFEGTIPAGEYGGGTVLVWDRGTYQAATGGVAALRQGHADGKIDFELAGERLKGRFALVRTRAARGRRSGWLLIKHRDEFARPGSDITAEQPTSVKSGRSLDEIAAARGAVWRSKAKSAKSGTVPRTAQPRRAATALPAEMEPMYASIGAEIPGRAGWTYEPKYDGIRVLAYAQSRQVRLVTRNGKDKAAQFPEVTEALRKLAARVRRPLVLDGEIAALVRGGAARFQELQSRMHVKDREEIAGHAADAPAALFVFDLLLDGKVALLDEPWTVRRARLEERLRGRESPHLRLGESLAGDGDKLLARARASGWEGIIAKRMDAPYEPGRRTRAWLKLKVEYRQEFVVGGYTEPRNSRQHLGALLVGYLAGGQLVYAGHVGGGFDSAGLRDMHARLRPLEQERSPFSEEPKTNERAHWVRPEVVVEVKFSEWTADGKLRQPIFLGVRDDKDAREVGREAPSVQAAPRRAGRAPNPGASTLLEQIERLQAGGGNGTLDFGKGVTLPVSHLDKIFFPGEGHSKGALMRYYVEVAPFILPAIADRPLVLKRFPNGITGKSFFQHQAPAGVPEGVRVTAIAVEGMNQERLIGGDLPTLLYTVQLGSISVDPWLTRTRSLDAADYAIVDLDPAPDTPFRRLVDVALWVKEQLDALGLHGALKTSGSRGLHVAIPLAARTSFESALLTAQLVAMRVAAAHPQQATVERSIGARAAGTVYLDYLQNVLGKTVAAAYCVRARPGATVSTPIAWDELTPALDPNAFTIKTMPARLAEVGDLWAAAMKKGNSLRSVVAAGSSRRRSAPAPRRRRS